MTANTWPIADFDEVRRLRVASVAHPAARLWETVLDAPPSTVWAVAGDLENMLARWAFPDIRAVRIIDRDQEQLRALVIGHTGLRARFDVVMRPGWCLMQSRFLVGGMAATEANGQTRFAFLSGLRGRQAGVFAPLVTPLNAATGPRALRHLARLIDATSAPENSSGEAG